MKGRGRQNPAAYGIAGKSEGAVKEFDRRGKTAEPLLTVALPDSSNALGPRLENLEARAGIEPAHRAFAELGLTTWLPRPNSRRAHVAEKKSVPQVPK